MDKSKLSETDICEKFISPALTAAGWDVHEQILREYPLRPGRMVVRGQKASRDKKSVLRADYVLFWKANIPLAVIEAKDNTQAVGAGMQQALSYAELLGVPFMFASNGDGFVFRDATLATGTLEANLALDQFPPPAELWARLCAHRGWTPEEQAIAGQAYSPSKTPRYYQLNAINRTVEAIAQGRNRILLVMATGTGKTYTAFQIIYRLWKSSWRADKPSGQKRILFLADRNILIDQTMVNDFRPFKGAMAKLSPNAKGVERVDAATGKHFFEDLDVAVNKTTKQVDKSYEIYLSLYQAVSGTDEEQNIYKQFSPDFFDLIVVDECHRGSADEDSAWREILTYFKGATQIGLTATPKETEHISNTEYFGEPVYTYSLKQGIEDGYLAPYKVIRVDLDKDTFGWRPPEGMLDKLGNVIEDRIYNATDMNRKLVLERRDEVVAAKITEYLKATDRYAKTIVFCEDIGLLEADIAGGREEVRQKIAGILTPAALTPAATATHEALLDLGKARDGRTRLITTNFDRLFEEVIKAKGLAVQRFLAPLLPVPKNRWDGLVYLHGLLPDPLTASELDRLVVSSGDFGLAYLNERWAARFVSELFRNYTVCFVGYSINDPVLRYMMDALAADRLLGESPPDMYAFGSFSKGKEDDRRNE